MYETFYMTLNLILMMFTFMAIGFVIRKRKIGGDSVPTVLSSLIVNIFLPSMIFLTFEDKFHIETKRENFPYLLAGIIVLFFTFFVSKLFAKMFAETDFQKSIYMYSFLIPNFGYMGFPLVGGVFGDDLLYKMMMFAIPYQVIIYTYGLYLLNPNHALSFQKIINPSTVAMVVGMSFGLFHLKAPQFIRETLVCSKACMSPSAMILTGVILAEVDVRELFRKTRYYIAALIRVLVLPAIVFGMMYLFRVDRRMILVSVAMLAMPFGLNSVVFPKAFGEDGSTGAKTCFIANIFGIVTIPTVFALLQILL